VAEPVANSQFSHEAFCQVAFGSHQGVEVDRSPDLDLGGFAVLDLAENPS